MKNEVIEGVIQGNEKGYAFLIPTNPEYEDFFIPHSDLKGAMHKDVVLAKATYGKGERTTACVLKILERGLKEVVGTYSSTRTGGFVIPDDKKYSTDIYVPMGVGLKAKTGDKVVCKIISYPHRKSPEGIIKEILGKQNQTSAELKSILRAYNLVEIYPKNAIDYSSNINQPTTDDLVGRVDFTNLTTMTIDGDDSRDFDDAISIQILDNDNYLLGVHIADVSHYVKSGDVIDCEALKRATSVYFPHTVLPMLPEKLCNDVCSLKEGEVRLTLSCMITVDKHGNVVNSEICKSFIKSKARMTYNNVQAILDGDKQLCIQYRDILDDIFLFNELADILISHRETSGYIDLDVKESSISIQSDGSIKVGITPRDKAHRIIEEFMILANVCVAKFTFNNQLPAIYRIHERPDEEKYKYFLTFLKGLGINVGYKEELETKDYQSILNRAKNNSAFSVINRVMLRSMQKAKYSPIQKGHFGLGEFDYLHFTSPIRRYPDLFVHRVIKDFMDKGKDFVYKKYSSVTKNVANRSSEMERNVMEAERAVDDYFKMLYISDFVGEEFEGVISGVTSFGLFVELANGIEGLVKLETLDGDDYQFDNQNYLLANKKNKYRLGQNVLIKVAGINQTEKRAEFILIKNLQNNS